MDIAQIVRVMSVLSHFCLLLCHPTPWRTYQPLFLPGPQFCPDTGRTVCAAVDYYPTDQIFHLLTSARSQVFNLTSLFVDERKGDVEPNLSELPTHPPYYQDGYGNSQPPPGGRFSPAGYTINNWNPATSDTPPNYPGQPQDRWRYVSQGNNNNNNGNNGQSVVSRSGYGSRRQSRAQNMSYQRRNANSRDNPSAAPKYNYGVPTKQGIGSNNFANPDYGVTQHNRIEPYNVNNGYNRAPHFRGNFSEFHPQDVQRHQEPYQIQPPFVQHTVKGQGMYPVMTTRPRVDGNWKGSPSIVNYRKAPIAESLTQNPNHSRFNRRERRNQDIELACQVQSTYVVPRAALNDNSEWKFVINVPERDRRFSQVVRVDVCLNADSPCSSRLSLPFGFESRCKQKYIKKKLLSLNADGQGTSEDSFFIPSCCVCEITRPNKRK